jgi:hypothetical protein
MHRRWIGVALLALLGAESARAQFVAGRVGGAYTAGSSLSLGYQGKRFVVGVSFGPTSIYRYRLIGPPFMGGLYGCAGPGPLFAPSFATSPLIVIQQPIIVRQPVIVVPPPPELTGEPRVPDPDRFIVIKPNKPNDLARNKAPNPVLAPPAKVAAKPKAVDLGIVPAELPLAPARAANPRAEAERQIELGQSAFAKGEYGRSIECFRRAVTVMPDGAPAWFLLSQAQFAVGKFDDAVASIVDGLKVQPDWPASRFQSRELYGNNAGAYAAHLDNLRAALAANPDDPRLQFLLGVHLWFDGQKVAARPLFEQAAKLAKDPKPIERFWKK